jgi:hypothetical protein
MTETTPIEQQHSSGHNDWKWPCICLHTAAATTIGSDRASLQECHQKW